MPEYDVIEIIKFSEIIRYVKGCGEDVEKAIRFARSLIQARLKSSAGIGKINSATPITSNLFLIHMKKGSIWAILLLISLGQRKRKRVFVCTSKKYFIFGTSLFSSVSSISQPTESGYLGMASGESSGGQSFTVRKWGRRERIETIFRHKPIKQEFLLTNYLACKNSATTDGSSKIEKRVQQLRFGDPRKI